MFKFEQFDVILTRGDSDNFPSAHYVLLGDRFISETGYINLDYYNSGFDARDYQKCFDVMKVYRGKKKNNLPSLLNTDKMSLIWEREKNIVINGFDCIIDSNSIGIPIYDLSGRLHITKQEIEKIYVAMGGKIE